MKPYEPTDFERNKIELEKVEKKPIEKQVEKIVEEGSQVFDVKILLITNLLIFIFIKDEFAKKLTDLTVPEHRLALFECHASDLNANVNWFLNDQPVDTKNKRFKLVSLGAVRRLTIRDCLKNETNSQVKCKWNNLDTEAKLTVTGIRNFIIL